MAQHLGVDLKLSDQQLNILKSETKIAKDLTSRLLPNKIGIGATNFAHNLLLTDRQVSNLLEITYR